MRDPTSAEADWTAVPRLEPCVPALISHCHRHWPDKDLLVFDDEHLTYRAAVEQSAGLACQLLAAGIGKGARVGLLFPNSPRFVVTWLAIVRIGAVAVPISTLSTAVELLRVLRHADVHLLIACDRYLHHDYVSRVAEALPGIAGQRPPFHQAALPYLRAIWFWGDDAPLWAHPVDLSAGSAGFDAALLAAVESEVAPGDAVSIIYTSGSTADPKGVVHSHGNFMRQAAKLVACNYGPFAADERVFTLQPFFWVGGLTFTLLNVMMRGAACICSSRSAGAALLDLLQRERVTYVHGWRHLSRSLVADPSFAGRTFAAMRGGTLYEALPAAARPADEGLVGTALGMTETSGPHTVEHRALPERLRGSFGTPMPGLQHRVTDVETGLEVLAGQVGQLLIRGDTLMLGLLKREASSVFDPDGWYATGDLVCWRDGHLFFHGRLDDVIKTAGANVSPQEVEQVLTRQPGVGQAFVFGVPDPHRGSVVGAILVPQPNGRLDRDAVIRQAAGELSSYKVPRVTLVLQAIEIPLASSSKPDRRRLRTLLEDAHLKLPVGIA